MEHQRGAKTRAAQREDRRKRSAFCVAALALIGMAISTLGPYTWAINVCLWVGAVLALHLGISQGVHSKSCDPDGRLWGDLWMILMELLAVVGLLTAWSGVTHWIRSPVTRWLLGLGMLLVGLPVVASVRHAWSCSHRRSKRLPAPWDRATRTIRRLGL
jgi:hypothetical protein